MTPPDPIEIVTRTLLSADHYHYGGEGSVSLAFYEQYREKAKKVLEVLDANGVLEAMEANENMVPLLSRALDEIYESLVTEAHLGYKSFPKSRRQYAEAQVERMRACARGEYKPAYHAIRFPKRDLALAGASQTLTRYEWEAEAQ